MFNKALLMAYTKEVEDTRYTLRFVASKDGSGINFFTDVNSTYHPDSAFTVKINGEVTEQSYRSMSFKKGDLVTITCDKGFSFPRFCAKDTYCVREVSQLPYMTASNGNGITTFEGVFQSSSLTSIPENLFDNNVGVTSFYSAFFACSLKTSIPENLFAKHVGVTSFYQAFYMCSTLSSIPENLFANNTNATDFRYVFYNCLLTSVPEKLFANNTNAVYFDKAFAQNTRLTSVPENLFANNTNATRFEKTFYNCSSLSGRVKIGSPNVTNCKEFCYGTGAMTVIVPAGSTTEATFRAYAETVTNLTVETFEP